MTILAFPSTPSTHATLQTIYKLAERFPRWGLSVDTSEDGRPCAAAEHRTLGAVLLAHWDRNGWAVLTEDCEVVARSPSLDEALSTALA